MQYRLTDLAPLNHDVTRLTLTPASGGTAPFNPGQYLDIVLDPEIRCSYSIACAPCADGHLELHVRAMPQSDNYLRLKERLLLGNMLEIALPFGEVYLETDGRLRDEQSATSDSLLLLVGSTGFSQAKALIEGWVIAGCPRPLQLYWGGRRPSDLYMHDWATHMARQHPGFHYIPVVSDEADQWQGRIGLVHQAVLADAPDFNALTVVGCGSPAMVYAAYDDFIAAGMHASRMRSDVFAYAPR